MVTCFFFPPTTSISPCYAFYTDSTKEPHNLTLAAGVTSINASWEQDNSLFEDYTFEFSVTWQEVDAANIVGIVVNRTTFNIQGLKPGTNYSICVTAIINSDEQVRSEKTCRPIKTFELSGKTVHMYICM